MISVSDPNPDLVEIILSISENYPKVYCVAQHTVLCCVYFATRGKIIAGTILPLDQRFSKFFSHSSLTNPNSAICIRQWPSNHACWWRLTNSGRGTKKRHGNCRWIPPEAQVKLSTTKAVLAVFTSTTRKVNVSWKSTKTTKPCPSVPSPHTSEECWTEQLRTADTSSHFINSWHHALHSWGAWLGCWSNNFANSHLTLVHSTAEYCAPVWCRSANTCTGFILYGGRIKSDFDTVVINLVGSLHYCIMDSYHKSHSFA